MGRTGTLQTRMRPLTRFFVTAAIGGGGLAVGVLALIPAVHALGSSLQGHAQTANVTLDPLAQRSLVYDHNGDLLASLHADQNRSPVPLEKVPAVVQDAVLDVEDNRFYDHGGVDLRSLVRAFRTNVNGGGVLQGGSTITQQLVKNSILTPERNVHRKVKEAVLALRLEGQMTKPQILERYLNTVYFGNGAYGVQAAAEAYFNTDVGHLNAGQAALLAGLIRNPDGYDPLHHPAASRARRAEALDRMVVNNHLSQADADALKTAPVPARVFTPVPAADDYFTEEVKQALLADPRLGDSYQQRYNALFKGGLKIYASIDPALQLKAIAAVRDQLPDNVSPFTASLISVEPDTGYVRAMVAGSNFDAAHYNLATGRGGTGRQPGSSFKPFVLAAHLEAGGSVYDTVDGTSPCTLHVPGYATYTAHNVEGEANGALALRDALAHSINCAYIRLGVAVGLDKVTDMAKRLGVRSALHPVPSMALGTEEVSPLDMASAYATLAADGVYHQPRFVEKVVDANGKVLFGGPDKGKQVISSQVARQVVQAMQAVVQYGTGRGAALHDRPVAGKTGTTENFSDAWFVGYTPQLSTAVWMGDPSRRTPMRDVGGIRVFGGTYPAAIWRQFMENALDGEPVERFEAPGYAPAGKYIYVRGASSPAPSPAWSPAPAGPAAPASPTTTVGDSPTTSQPSAPPPTQPPATEPPTTAPRPPPPTTSPPTTQVAKG